MMFGWGRGFTRRGFGRKGGLEGRGVWKEGGFGKKGGLEGRGVWKEGGLEGRGVWKEGGFGRKGGLGVFIKFEGLREAF